MKGFKAGKGSFSLLPAPNSTLQLPNPSIYLPILSEEEGNEG